MASMRSIRRNLPYFRSEFNSLLANTSVTVKCICATVICSYVLSFYSPSIDFLSVTPGKLLPPSFWVWTFFTYPYLEIHLWEVLVDIITVGLCGKLIEPLWGTREMLRFFGILNVSVVVLSVSYYLFLYALTFDPSILFDVKIHGLSGYIAAVSVAVRQIMPDHVLVRTPLGKLTNRNVPLTVLFVSIIMWAIGLLEGSYCTMFGSGILSAWIYLRFYQKHSNGSRGDTADSFTFASFFPNVLQPAISVIANSIFHFLVKIGICKKQVKRFSESSGPSSINISIPGSDPNDAERRRQKALKLLSERLGNAAKDEAKVPLIRPESPGPSSSSSRSHSNINISSNPATSDTMTISQSASQIHKSHSAGSNLTLSSSFVDPVSSQRKGDVVIPVSNQNP